jgi:DNA-binding response OmpR family regulator
MPTACATVLVVDDDPDIRMMLDIFLVSRGYAVVTASDGLEALDQLRVRRPDVMLLDATMPALDGWSLLEQMKQPNGEFADVPVVMVTALGGVPDRLRGEIGGALRYITKPFALDDITGAIDEMVADDAPPEPIRRRAVQRAAPAHVVRIEAGQAAAAPED